MLMVTFLVSTHVITCILSLSLVVSPLSHLSKSPTLVFDLVERFQRRLGIP